MTSEFPGNSNAKKSAPVPKKKVEKVVTGEVIKRKKPLSRKFRETFSMENNKTVASNLIFNIFIPGVKDIVADLVTQGVEQKLFGESRPRGRRGYTPGPGAIFGNATYHAYNRYAGNTSIRPDPRSGGPTTQRTGRAPHSAYDEIILSSRAEATEVLDQMIAIISQYGAVSVADLFDLVGATGEFTEEKWGWTDLMGADVQRVHEGYLLNLPRPIVLD